MTGAAVPRWVAYSGVAVVGGTAAAVTAYYLDALGVDAGMPPALAWTLPVALDWGGVVAGVFWFRAAGVLRQWGRWTALGCLAASSVGNIGAHAVAGGGWYSLIGLVFPVACWTMAKLLVLWQRDHHAAVGAAAAAAQAAVERDAKRRAKVSSPRTTEPTPAPVVRARAAAVPAATSPNPPEDLLGEARRVVTAGGGLWDRNTNRGGVGRTQLITALGVGDDKARRLLAALRAEQHEPLRAVK